MKQFTHLSDTEMLREIDEVRLQSPIIADLCRRLEEAEPNPLTASCECPRLHGGPQGGLRRYERNT